MRLVIQLVRVAGFAALVSGCETPPSHNLVPPVQPIPTTAPRPPTPLFPEDTWTQAPSIPVLYPTSVLLGVDPLARLADEVAAFRSVDSAHVGYGATPSPSHAAFAKLAAQASKAQLATLLHHESSTVRGYAARAVLDDAQPEHLRDLEALIGDFTPVKFVSGCQAREQPLAEYVIEGLCKPRPEEQRRVGPRRRDATALLEKAARGRTAVARLALECLPERSPRVALELADSWLLDETTPPPERETARQVIHTIASRR